MTACLAALFIKARKRNNSACSIADVFCCALIAKNKALVYLWG
jgi:hypothetical protein